MSVRGAAACLGFVLAVACSFDAKAPLPTPDSGFDTSAAGAAGRGDQEGVDSLSIDVPEGAKVFVTLGPLGEAMVEEDGSESAAWDLAFSGWDVFTNSGVSGPGKGGGFGPFESVDFALGFAEAPFIRADETGGAFLDWYDYDGSTHALFSRYHVYGVRAAHKLYKVQILGYYGEVQGAPVSALYQLRYAEVTADGSGDTQSVENIDATAGWPKISDDAPSGCLKLDAGATLAFTPDEARLSDAWDLCFRRDGISVNGELGGPGGVGAVDLDATESETEEEIQARTAGREESRFDSTDFESLNVPNLAYRGDRIVSIFSDAWADRSANPRAAMNAAWLVVAADGAHRFLIVLELLGGSTDQSMGRVSLRVRAVE